MRYPRLLIIHNHGTELLADAVLDEHEGSVTGTVVNGYSTSRLFHATHTKFSTPGTTAKHYVWGRRPRPVFTNSGWVNGLLDISPTPGEFEVDMTFCG